jgi:hypothetical protein
MSMMPGSMYDPKTNQQVPTARIEAPDDPAAPDVKPPRPKLPTRAEKKAALAGGLRASFGDDFARRLLGEDVPRAVIVDAVTCGETVLSWARGHAAALQAAAWYARGKAYADAAAFDPHALDRPRACVATEARAIIEAGECRAREYERAFEAWRLTGPFLCWQDAELLGTVLIESLAETEALAETEKLAEVEVETTETEPRKFFQRR